MPRRKQIQTLLLNSAQSLVNHFYSLGEAFISNAISYGAFTQSIITLQLLLRNIHDLHNLHIATFWLTAADKLALKYNFPDDAFPGSSMPKILFVVDSLVEIATNFNVEKLDIAYWSELVGSSLIKNLHRMGNLRRLSEVDDEFPTEKNIIYGFPYLTDLKHLTSIHSHSFTDQMTLLLYENCKQIKTITLCSSQGVTDDSIVYLAQFEKLQSLDVTLTKVTGKGLVKLLVTSQSENLMEIKLLTVDNLIDHLVTDVVPFRTFDIERLHCDIDSNQLYLIPVYFPFLTKIYLEHGSGLDISSQNISFFNSLERLEEAGLEIRDYQQHLELTSLPISMLTELFLEWVSEIDLLQLALQLPNLQSICIHSCSISNVLQHDALENAFKKLKFFEFSHWKDVDEDLLVSITGVQKILSHAFDIEKFQFRAQGLSDYFITSICQSNPLNKLEQFYLHTEGNMRNISIRIMKDLIKHCPEISSVKLFSIFSTDELEDLHKFVIENNYDIKLTAGACNRDDSRVFCRGSGITMLD